MMNPLWQILIGLATSGGLFTVLIFFLGKKEKELEREIEEHIRKREEEEQKREKQWEDTRKRDETWFKEADQAYKRVENECNKCHDRLSLLSTRFYKLLAALDEICDNSIGGIIQVVDLRLAVRIAREEKYNGST